MLGNTWAHSTPLSHRLFKPFKCSCAVINRLCSLYLRLLFRVRVGATIINEARIFDIDIRSKRIFINPLYTHKHVHMYIMRYTLSLVAYGAAPHPVDSSWLERVADIRVLLPNYNRVSGFWSKGMELRCRVLPPWWIGIEYMIWV